MEDDSPFDDKEVKYLTESNRKDVFRELYMRTPVGWKIAVQPPGRTLDQNAKLWPMLEDIAKQVEWYGQHLTREDWKDIFTAALLKAKVVPGLDGGFVVCGLHTSKFSKAKFSDLIELIYAFGAERSVQWSEKAKDAYSTYRS